MDLRKFSRLAREVDLFQGLTPEDIAKIYSRGMTMRVQKGETVFFKGSVGSQMYVVLGGSVGVYDGQKRIAGLRTGDMFGEMALIDSAPRSATVVADEDTHLFVLSETTFQRLLTKRVSIWIFLNIIHTLSKRLRDANAHFAGS